MNATQAERELVGKEMRDLREQLTASRAVAKALYDALRLIRRCPAVEEYLTCIELTDLDAAIALYEEQL